MKKYAMLTEDFTIETVEVNGIPVQTFKKRYRNLRQMLSESIAAHLHHKILDVSIFGLPDPVMGSIVACAIVSRPDAERLTAEEVQAFCRDQLASYKIPQRIFFVPDLPRNPGGKVIKGKLVEQFQTT